MSNYYTLQYFLQISLLLALVNQVTFSQLDNWHLEVLLFKRNDLFLASKTKDVISSKQGYPCLLVVKSAKLQMTYSVRNKLMC